MPTINTFDDLLTHGRQSFADNILTGVPFGQGLSAFMQVAAAFGREEAQRGGSIGASVDYGKFDDLLRDYAIQSYEDLFNGGSIANIVRDAALAGAAFGFQTEKRRLIDDTAEAILAELREITEADNSIPTERANAFFEHILTLNKPEMEVGYARRLIRDFRFDAAKCESFTKFVEKYEPFG